MFAFLFILFSTSCSSCSCSFFSSFFSFFSSSPPPPFFFFFFQREGMGVDLVTSVKSGTDPKGEGVDKRDSDAMNRVTFN